MSHVPDRVAAWHNRHPLARRVEPAQVRAVGYVALPFATAAAGAAPAAPAPAADAPAAGGTLRERALARSRGQGDPAPVPAQEGAAAPAPDAAGGSGGGGAAAPAGAASATATVPPAALVPAFTEDFIAPLRPADVARWAARHGSVLTQPPRDAPVRNVAAGALPAGLRPVTVYVLTAAIEAGGHRSRVLVGRGGQPALLGRRLWSRMRLGAASALGGAACAAAVAALFWPQATGPQDLAGVAPAASTAGAAVVAEASSAGAAPAATVVAAAPAAEVPAVQTLPPVAMVQAEPGSAVANGAAAPGPDAARPLAVEPRPAVATDSAAAPAPAAPASVPPTPAPAAVASRAPLAPRLHPDLGVRESMSAPRVALAPPLDDAARAAARREVDAARAALRGASAADSARTPAAATAGTAVRPPTASAASANAPPTTAPPAPVPAGTAPAVAPAAAPPPAAPPVTPPPAVAAPGRTPAPAPHPGASAGAAAATVTAAARAAATTAFAVTTRPLRTRAEADQVRTAMDALLRTPRGGGEAPAGLRVEVLPQGDDWRVVGWPYARRGEADQARTLLVGRGLRVEVVAY